MNSKKVVVSGSFRKHLHAVGRALAHFEKIHCTVLAPQTQKAINEDAEFVLLTTDDPKKSPDTLEREFMENIKRADFLYVANIGGYIGQSVATEMGVAIMNGIPVVVAETIKSFSDAIPYNAQRLLTRAPVRELPIENINAKEVNRLHDDNFDTISVSPEEQTLLQSLVEKLLYDLKSVTINP